MTKRSRDRIVDRRMYVSKIILTKLSKGSFRWRDLVKIVLAESPSYSSFDSTLRWLIRQGYITRRTRGIYEITDKGRDFLKII